MRYTHLVTLLTCILALALTCKLNAQDSSTEASSESGTEVKAPVENTAEETDSTAAVTPEPDDDLPESQATEAQASDEEDVIQAIDSEANEVTPELDEEELDEEEEELEEEEEEKPVFVSVDQDGRLIGLVTATVTGDLVPVEANVSLVRDGVLLSKIVADEDGAFAFPNVAPGEYNMYGAAGGYCGQQCFTVLPTSQECTICDDSLSLQLTQGGGCYRGFGGAPASSFTSNSIGGGFVNGGGFVSGGGGGFFSGGGFAGGGGGAVAASRTGLRLLAIGGIATAIAVGDDDASPSE